VESLSQDSLGKHIKRLLVEYSDRELSIYTKYSWSEYEGLSRRALPSERAWWCACQPRVDIAMSLWYALTFIETTELSRCGGLTSITSIIFISTTFLKEGVVFLYLTLQSGVPRKRFFLLTGLLLFNKIAWRVKITTVIVFVIRLPFRSIHLRNLRRR